MFRQFQPVEDPVLAAAEIQESAAFPLIDTHLQLQALVSKKQYSIVNPVLPVVCTWLHEKKTWIGRSN